MNKKLFLLAVASLLGSCAPRPAVTPPGSTPVCRECKTIERRFKAHLPAVKKVRGDALQMPRTAALFYRDRAYAAVWSADGRPSSGADALLRELQTSDWEGLTPADYHVRALESLRKKWPAAPTADFLADFDMLLTDGYLLYASHLLGGRTNVEMARVQWKIIRKKANPADLLNSALDSNEVAGSLRTLQPPHEGYNRLKSALALYRTISRAGGWPVIPEGEIVKPGASDPRVGILRRRLAIEAGEPTSSSDSIRLDGELVRKIRGFQKTHGIETDGRLGADTLAALNVPVEDRINQIKFSMDRWRWLPFDLGRRYVLINIPEFRLYGREEGRDPLVMAVIVGKSDDETATPEFSNEMTYLEFSPEWNVPNRIATQEMLPTIRKDATYFTRNHLEVLVREGEAWSPVDAGAIDWATVSTTTAGAFPYRFRQRPGAWNGLGPVKFMFPNEYSVYIHGNADEGLFDRRLRMFSHGCVRVDEPMRLAQWMLNDPDWTKDRIRQYMRQPEPVIVPLGEPVPVFLVYWTAWVDEDGRAQFREDIYGRDKAMRDRFYPEP